MIEILRLSHRLPRDCRITTHCALTARAFGATKIFYSGQKDKGFEQAVEKTTKQFGGPFEVEYTKEPIKLIKQKKKENYSIIHLTAYGLEFEKEIKKIKKLKKVLFIIGSSKVDPEYYKLADYNLSISNEPISEVSALGIILYELYGIKKYFKEKKIEITPSNKKKIIKTVN